ncbi:MAG: hypothetical protein HZC40_06200 [Chloroflexi bacterium]|nr:hypothetical protein [Chloroflexota bacterium]
MKDHYRAGRLARFSLFVLVLIVFLYMFSLPYPVAAQGPANVVVRQFNGDLRNLPQIKDTTNFVRPVLDPPSVPLRPSSVSAPARSPAPHVPLAPMPSPLSSFEGLDKSAWGAGWPPDTNGDVGPSVYMQGVNTSIGIYDKTTGGQITAFTFNSFWSGAGTGTACDANNRGDIIVLYDPLQDRWLFMDFAFVSSASPPYYFCFAVSKTSDPISGGWWMYAYLAQNAAGDFPDYPKGGVWTDGFYFSANMYTGGAGSPVSVRLYAFDRLAMESGVFRVATADIAYANRFFTLLPANIRGALPPTGRNEFFVSQDFSFYQFDVWTASPNYGTGVLTMTGPTAVSQISGYGVAPSTVTSPGNNIATLTFRSMVQAQYRNFAGVESLWFNHTTGAAGGLTTPTGVHWAQINVTGGAITAIPVQEQIFNNGADGLNRFMGSLAVDGTGNMAVGYTVENAATHPDIRYAGRLVSDVLSTLPQSETTMLSGVTRVSPTNLCGNPLVSCTRWGDYSLMSVDPVDDCTFWYTNEYYLTGDTTNWRTRIGSFTFAQPAQCNPISNQASALTNHTITFDGNAQLGNDFHYATEWLGSKGGIDYYATWDATNVYVGMIGGALTTTAGSACPTNGCTYVAVVDTDPRTQSSANTGAASAFQCSTFDANAKGNFAISRANGATTKRQASGGSWVAWSPTNSNALDNGYDNAEFRFQFSELTGYPSGDSFALYLYVCDGANLVSAWPPENPQTGATPALSVTTNFATNDAGRAPRTFGRHWGKQSQSASTTGVKTFFNGYLTFNVTTNGGGACTLDVNLIGNMDNQASNIIRRTYTITPNNCTGLVGDLTLKYEDGSLTYGTTMNNAPNEIRAFTESAMALLRQVGSNWADQSATSRDTAANTVTKTGVSSFSTWTLGSAAPTAVTLASFDQTREFDGMSFGFGAGALAMLGAAIWIARRKIKRD